MSLASRERAALSDELERVGPDRPTLCAGWTTGDLLAHLLVRERQPWAAAGIMVPALAAVTERAMRSFRDLPWLEAVQLFRSGPQSWSPMRIGSVDAAANGMEFFVHHEDVRRGEPGELVLFAFGRDAARVELQGEPGDVEALAKAPRGV